MGTEKTSNGFLTISKLLTITDSISDGVLAVDLHMRVTFFNNAAVKITGIPKKNAIGKKCYELLRTDVCDSACALRQTFETGKPVINYYICSTRSDGKRVPISVSTALLQDENGEIVGGVETFRDLSQVETLRKELERNYSFSDMIGRSGPMKDLFDLIPIVAQSDSTILIEGESGTGKEMVARAIHNTSPRRDHPMISVNCGAIPDTLLESELFGYKAGAFTNAKKDKKGRFALAEGGTLFLDEIGELSPALQVKLLRVLEEFVYEPLGSTVSEKADIRIITATNRHLPEQMQIGNFREDLYYRLNVFCIKLAPLRERMTDVPLLIDHFIGKYNHLRNKDISGITPAALSILMEHHYPGNVRELENIIEHAFVLCPGGVIKPEFLPEYLHEKRSIPVVEIAGTMAELEALFTIAALKRNNWNRKKTAESLGIDPSTLYRKIKKFNLKTPTTKHSSRTS